MEYYLHPSGDYFISNFSSVNISEFKDAYVYEDNGDVDTDVNTSSQTVATVVPIVFCVLAVIGVLTNSGALTLLYRKRKKLYVAESYLLYHYICNILHLTVFVPIIAVYYGNKDWIFGDIACKLVNYGMTGCLAASLLCITVACLHNSLGSCGVQNDESMSWNPRSAKLLTVAVGLVTAVSLVPRVFLYTVDTLWQVEDLHKFCTRNLGPILYRRVDTCVMFLALYLAPFIIQVACHIRVFRDLKNRVEHDPRLGNRLVVAKVLAAISIALFVGWLPTHLIHFGEDFAVVKRLAALLRHGDVFAYGFSYVSMSLTPLVYYIFQRRLWKHASYTVSRNDDALFVKMSACTTEDSDIEDKIALESRKFPLQKVTLL